MTACGAPSRLPDAPAQLDARFRYTVEPQGLALAQNATVDVLVDTGATPIPRTTARGDERLEWAAAPLYGVNRNGQCGVPFESDDGTLMLDGDSGESHLRGSMAELVPFAVASPGGDSGEQRLEPRPEYIDSHPAGVDVPASQLHVELGGSLTCTGVQQPDFEVLSVPVLAPEGVRRVASPLSTGMCIITNSGDDTITTVRASSGFQRGPRGEDTAAFRAVTTGSLDDTFTVTELADDGSMVDQQTIDAPAERVAPGHASWLDEGRFAATCNGGDNLVIVTLP